MIQKLQKFFNRKQLIWLVFFSSIIFLISIKGSIKCVSGFPIKFWSNCIDVGYIPLSKIIFGSILDFFTCFIIVLFTYIFFRVTFITKYIKYILNPLLLTILSFASYDGCSGIICLFPGHGLPLGYFYDHSFVFKFFLIDFIIFAIINFVVLMMIQYFKKRFI